MNKYVSRPFKFLCLLFIALLIASFFITVIINLCGGVRVEAESFDSSFRDCIIVSGDETVDAIDGEHNTVWSVSFVGQDKEMLPNGNLLLTSQKSGTSSVIEVDIDSNSIVWEISNVDGLPLEFTHDADWLGVDQFGQDIYLIADTLNDRAVEFFRNGTVIWSWYAIDHYSYGNSSSWDWSHLNDVDRLPDGTTMISLKNFNKVAIVNTTATGEVLWEYGEYDDTVMLNGPHNPEYTPAGTLLIADSGNHRIIEVDMTTKEIIWDYTPTGEDYLGWPRDADLLPNGNLLISDTGNPIHGKDRIYELNTTTKEVVWYHDTGVQNYDSDYLDTLLPTVNILSPAAGTYDGVAGVPVSFSCDDPWYDEMKYRIYDETAGQWVTAYNVTYDGETEVFLENQHTYTLHVWAKDVVMEGGAYPTSRAIVQLEEASVQFTTALDETAPEISDVDVVAEGDLTFAATVTDDVSGVKQVTLAYFYSNGSGTWDNMVSMVNAEGNIWSVIVPAFLDNTTLTYTITAEDNADNIVATDELVYDYIIPEISSLGFLSLFLVASLVALIYRNWK